MNTDVDNYFIEGCGRCPLFATPECKVHRWPGELAELRRIILECGLTEESKWGVPCYTYDGKNVIILSALNDFCNLAFFKGVLLQDNENLLVKPGPNSQSDRYMKFTSVKDILDIEPIIKAYIFEAIEVEKAGLKVEFNKNPEPIPEELQQKLDEDPVFKHAFERLTPGRQRGYIIHFSQPKQSKTRIDRIKKYTPMILNGEGMHDKYNAQARKK
jgi:uncharacterized protein YdeI (YjbR/CyaY-like superfamily)